MFSFINISRKWSVEKAACFINWVCEMAYHVLNSILNPSQLDIVIHCNNKTNMFASNQLTQTVSNGDGPITQTEESTCKMSRLRSVDEQKLCTRSPRQRNKHSSNLQLTRQTELNVT